MNRLHKKVCDMRKCDVLFVAFTLDILLLILLAIFFRVGYDHGVTVGTQDCNKVWVQELSKRGIVEKTENSFRWKE